MSWVENTRTVREEKLPIMNNLKQSEYKKVVDKIKNYERDFSSP
jgi:hypothetical protein